MSLSLNVLNHLGLNLYSNVPAVLSEAVANAWDADATTVDVWIDHEEERIEIVDDGHGMDIHDVNNRYLHVGYRRRQDESRPNRTPEYDRPVMGRKGIGKLSLLSIAKTVEVYTAKDGERHAFRMEVDEIKEAIENDTPGNSPVQSYVPTAIDDFPADFEQGTKLVLTDLKKRVHTAEHGLKKRLARRFSILGPEYNFSVRVNGDEVDITDRDYFHKVQFLWMFSDDQYVDYCRDGKLREHEARDGETESGYEVHGWIGTVEKPGDLVEKYPGQETEADDLNKISLMVRGKMAKPNLLEDFNDSRMYTKYLVGEIHADFLDFDQEDDIATSSREDVVKEDPRYQELLSFLEVELNRIAQRWDDLRNAEGSDEARKIPAVDMWFESLTPDNRDRAKKLFGKINQITVNDESERKELFKHGVFAFENLRYEENLIRLDGLADQQDDREFRRTLRDLEDLEASRYRQIVTQRQKIAEELARRASNGALGSDIFDHIVDHPWLLDPSWERATGNPEIRDAVRERFDELNPELPTADGTETPRLQCIETATRYVIVDMRHPDDQVGVELEDWIEPYREAASDVLSTTESGDRSVDILFVVGDRVGAIDWVTKKEGAHVRCYDELLSETASTYASFLDGGGRGRVVRLIDEIDTTDLVD